MKKIILSIVAVLWAVGMWAVPAYPGWQTKRMADGSEVQVRLIGDEFGSYWASEDGKLMMEQADGTFVKSEKALPTEEAFREKRTRAREMRAGAAALTSNGTKRAKAVGTAPNLAPKGVVILVNFSDTKMKAAHTNAVFDNLCNAKKGRCTTNVHQNVQYESAAQYFSDQSNGDYRPQFDVFGPVTLPEKAAYYGEDGPEQEDGSRDHDIYIADFVIDAVLAADEAGCDFSQYDSNNDGQVDFVYLIYAGRNQAYGGEDETIWPHNYDFWAALAYGMTHGTSEYYIALNDYGQIDSLNVPQPDGMDIRNYACSSELDGYFNLAGIGTLCHEFGHVIGLPDFYDTQYGENEQQGLTPGAWDVMDRGSYNGNMHCPPNYDPWEKYFFGWIDPVNLGSTPANGVLYANGTEDYNVYQVNATGKKQSATADYQLNYYLENRQQTGWDKFLPAHGMVAWRVDYNSRIWGWNMPNNQAGNPRFTVAQVSDPWEAVEGKAVTEIEESDGVVSFKYMGGQVAPPCEMPTNLSAATTDTSATLTWEGEADGYEVRYIEGDGSDEGEAFFSGSTSFEGNLAGWTTIDADGDGHTWKAGDGFAYSESRTDGGDALTPNNYLVSPKIRMGGSIAFWVKGADSERYAEHFGVAISSESNTDAADFTMVSAEWRASKIWKQFKVDLSAYAGTGYVAIRHFNSTNLSELQVMTITIEAPEETILPWIVIDSISGTEYTLSDLKDSTLYTAQVRSRCGEEYSEWSPSVAFTTKAKAVEGVEDVQGDNVQGTKVLREGQLYLIYKGTMYDVQGRRVR